MHARARTKTRGNPDRGTLLCLKSNTWSTPLPGRLHQYSVMVSDKKKRESGSAPKMHHARGSAANHSSSSPGSPPTAGQLPIWHRQLASSRRSLTFSASAAAHAVSAAPALGGHPSGFLTSSVSTVLAIGDLIFKRILMIQVILFRYCAVLSNVR